MDAYIKSAFWTDARLEEQPAEIKLACMWLISNPSRDLLGFTRASNKRFSFETGLDPKFLDRACKALPTSFKEVAPGIYFAVNFLRHQFGRGGQLSPKNKVVVAVIRAAVHLPKPLASPFYEAYPELVLNEEKEAEKKAPHISPMQAPSEISEGVREEKSRVEKNSLEEGCGEKPQNGSKADVAGIVSIYPRRQGVAAACELVAGWLRKGDSAEAIIAGTRAHAAVIAQLPAQGLNTYVESAETFFRKRAWEDDPQARLRMASNGSGGAPVGKPEFGGRKATVIKISPNQKQP